jgi:hypothetical protein
LTRAAQALANAQDRARGLIRELVRDIGNSSGVRDNTGVRGQITVVTPGQAPNTFVASTLPSMKLDIIKPAEGDPRRGPTGAFINPDTGKEDPTLQAPKGQVVLPASGGMSLERVFVGLRQPAVDTDGDGFFDRPGYYNNPYDGLLMASNTLQDNLYVLLKANVQVKIWDRTLNKYVVNTAFFQDANGDDVPDDIDDPAFFTLLPGVDANYVTGALTVAGQAKAARIANWLKRSNVVTETSRFDMIAPVYDRRTRQVYYVGNVPQLVPLVRFQPTRVTSEPAAPKSAVRSGEETSNMIKIGPDMFRTQYGLWASLLMRTWPSAWPTNLAANGDRAGDVRRRWDQAVNGPNPYLVARNWYDVNGAERFSVFGFDPNTMTNDIAEGVEVFDVTRFAEVHRIPKPDWIANAGATYPYAFTEAVNAANARSGWLSQQIWRLNFVPFVPDTRNGLAISSFDSREVGNDQTIPFDYRVPTWAQQSARGLPLDLRLGIRVSPYDGTTALDYTPNNDPDVATGNWYDTIFQPINRRFNKLWTDFPTLAPGLDRSQYVKRFIDLRVMPQADGTNGPLDPGNGIARPYITPGSETIIGPDQRPGANYGKYVRYTRVSQRPVGANQYFINYVDQPEPDWSLLGIAFGGIVGNIYDPLDYSPTSLLQAVIEAPYRAGYVELNSRFGEPIPSGYTDTTGFQPTGNIFVSYRFQFTEPNDVVAVDYDSTQVMEINLTIRNYPQTQNIPNPQSITVKGSAEVRNFVR